MQFDIALAGLVVGTLVGLTGIGGGSLLTPTLILIFGVNPLTAIGSDLVYNAVTKGFGSLQHARQATISYRLAFTMAVGSLPAALAGIGLITLLEHRGVDINGIIRVVLATTLVAAGSLMLFRPLLVRRGRGHEVPLEDLQIKAAPTIALGAGVGFLVGLTSIGSGALIVPVLTLVYPLASSRVVGTDVFHAVLLAGGAAIAHWGAGNVDWSLTGNLLLGSIPGVLVGARLSVIAPDRVMRTALGVLVILSGIRLF